MEEGGRGAERGVGERRRTLLLRPRPRRGTLCRSGPEWRREQREHEASEGLGLLRWPVVWTKDAEEGIAGRARSVEHFFYFFAGLQCYILTFVLCFAKRKKHVDMHA